MAKRKKGSKVQKRAKLRRANSAKRSKARKVAKSAKATKRTAKPKPAPVKKAAPKEVAPAVETVAVEVIENRVPDVITVAEVKETAILKASEMPANGASRPAPPVVAADFPSGEAGPSAPPGSRRQMARPPWRSRA